MFSIRKLRKFSLNILFSRQCFNSNCIASYADCSYNPVEVDNIINTNALNIKLHNKRVSRFHVNQLGVNRPIEDRWNVGCTDLSNYKTSPGLCKGEGHIFSILDGHSGHASSHAVNYCHMDYVTASMLQDMDILQHYLQQFDENPYITLTKSFVPRNTWDSIATSVRESHIGNIRRYIKDLLSSGYESQDKCRQTAFHTCLSRLDNDMVEAAIPKQDIVNRPLLRSVSSGSVGCFLYIPDDEDNIYVAQVGDCGVVHGNRQQNSWSGQLLIEPHNYQSEIEIERVMNSHPINETNSLIIENRLLGELIPLRAFGNVRFKWPASKLQQTASILGLSPSYRVTPRHYQTPPYLICEPEVKTIKVSTPSTSSTIDNFFILASDGLWDCLTPTEAVETVGQWIDNNENLSTTTDNITSLLIKRALGGPDIDYKELSNLLALPGNVGRYYRDDITIIVVFLT